MLYLYDSAICDDLRNSFNPDNAGEPAVKVYNPEQVSGIVAQVQQDRIQFPIITLQRHPDVNIDTARANFTRLHQGFAAVFDKENNNWYNERVIPVKLSYDLDVITTNTADMDEIVRELLFKYATMYFLTINLPYESKRKVRFGVVINQDSAIQRQTSNPEYQANGTLYRTKIQLDCEGCFLATYTPVALRRVEFDVEPTTKEQLPKRIAH